MSIIDKVRASYPLLLEPSLLVQSERVEELAWVNVINARTKNGSRIKKARAVFDESRDSAEIVCFDEKFLAVNPCAEKIEESVNRLLSEGVAHSTGFYQLARVKGIKRKSTLCWSCNDQFIIESFVPIKQSRPFGEIRFKTPA